MLFFGNVTDFFLCRSTQDTIKEVEYCNNYLEEGCSFNYDEKLQIRHKVNEQSPSQLTSTQSVVFEVNMADFRSKTMTYRALIKSSQVSDQAFYFFFTNRLTF